MNKILFITLLFIVNFSLQAQTTTRLLCKGTLETKTDDVPEVKETAFAVTLNTLNQTLELEGFWGCLADLGSEETRISSSQCQGRLPVKIDEGEITYFAKIDGPKYYAITNAILNRYSATLNINSYSFAKPESNARWQFIMIYGKLQCINQEKKF